MSPSANHKPRLSMWGMLLMLAQLPPNAKYCNVLATIKHSTQTLYIHTQACARRRTYWSQWHTWGNSRPRALPRLSFQLITKLKPPFAVIPPCKFSSNDTGIIKRMCLCPEWPQHQSLSLRHCFQPSTHQPSNHLSISQQLFAQWPSLLR